VIRSHLEGGGLCRYGSFSTNRRNEGHVGFAPQRQTSKRPPEMDAQCQSQPDAARLKLRYLGRRAVVIFL
jgi:hypothetical protein